MYFVVGEEDEEEKDEGFDRRGEKQLKKQFPTTSIGCSVFGDQQKDTQLYKCNTVFSFLFATAIKRCTSLQKETLNRDCFVRDDKKVSEMFCFFITTPFASRLARSPPSRPQRITGSHAPSRTPWCFAHIFLNLAGRVVALIVPLV